MKKSTLFKSIAAAALFMVGIGVNAQVTGTGTLVAKGAAPQDVDYVTVGSTMPYSVNAYDWGTMSSILSSAFKWEVSGDGTLYQSDGTSSLTEVGTTGFFTQKDISVKWTATGDKTLKLTETGKLSTDALTCAGAPVSLTVKVLDRPTVDWGTFTDPSGCSISGGATINLVCTGSKTISVNYSVTYTPLDAAVTPTVTTGTATVNVTGGAYAQTNVAGNFSVTAASAGKYEVIITGVTDVVSEKSFGALSVADKATAQYLGAAGTQYPLATSSKVFYVYPQPTTSPIQHITNL